MDHGEQVNDVIPESAEDKERRPFRAVLFDLDGTITDSQPGIAASVAYALEQFGIHVEDHSQLRCFMGPPLIDSFQQFFHFSYKDAERARDLYREYYNGGQIFNSRVYEGVPEMLEALREAGFKIALATSKPEVMALAILEHFGLKDHFHVITGAGMEDSVRHSKTDVIEEALNRLGMAGEERSLAVMVGDRRYDIQGAKNCGIRSVGAGYGYAEPGELEEAGADVVCPDVGSLREFLLKGGRDHD